MLPLKEQPIKLHNIDMATPKVPEIKPTKPTQTDSPVINVHNQSNQEPKPQIKTLSYSESKKNSRFLTILVSLTLLIIVFVLAYLIAYQSTK
jgi:hypothetical protein